LRGVPAGMGSLQDGAALCAGWELGKAQTSRDAPETLKT